MLGVRPFLAGYVLLSPHAWNSVPSSFDTWYHFGNGRCEDVRRIVGRKWSSVRLRIIIVANLSNLSTSVDQRTDIGSWYSGKWHEKGKSKAKILITRLKLRNYEFESANTTPKVVENRLGRWDSIGMRCGLQNRTCQCDECGNMSRHFWADVDAHFHWKNMG